MSSIVIDTSVVLNWFLPDEDGGGDELRRMLDKPGNVFLVPPIFWYETRSAMLAAVWRQRIEREDAHCYLQLVDALPLTYGMLAIEDVFDTANDLGLSIYDTAYLALAKNNAASLATFDKKLARCASQIDIPLIRLEDNA